VRIILVLALLVVISSPATAGPIVSMTVAPPNAEEGQYYLHVEIAKPVGPEPGEGNPCSEGTGVAPVAPAATSRDVGVPSSAAPFAPRCVAADSDLVCASLGACAGGGARASYDVANGNYTVGFDSPAGVSLGDGLHGSTGISIMADCETCPPPACC
jgi:hypothetical protein